MLLRMQFYRTRWSMYTQSNMPNDRWWLPVLVIRSGLIYKPCHRCDGNCILELAAPRAFPISLQSPMHSKSSFVHNASKWKLKALVRGIKVLGSQRTQYEVEFNLFMSCKYNGTPTPEYTTLYYTDHTIANSNILDFYN